MKAAPYTKTTVELPRDLLARLKAHAATSHTSLKKVMVLAFEAHLDAVQRSRSAEPAWKELAGAFKDSDDNALIRKTIDDEFSRIDLEAWK